MAPIAIRHTTEGERKRKREVEGATTATAIQGATGAYSCGGGRVNAVCRVYNCFDVNNVEMSVGI